MPQCLFCSETKLTKEHIWPDWIVREFARRVPPGKKQFTASYTRNKLPVRTWFQNTITHEAKLVCSTCNNKWMSQLETCAKPFLLPLIRAATRFCTIVGRAPMHSRRV